jgi:SAM-dependent methyltransferase
MRRWLPPARRRDVAAEFSRLEPWITRFSIRGTSYGGSVPFAGDLRVEWFRHAFADARTVLELGSLEGGMTFELARALPRARILGVEGRMANIEKSRMVQRLLGVRNVEFRQVNLEVVPLSDLGEFDAVLCAGLLYHLPRPWELLAGLRGVTDRVLVSTHYAAEDRADEVVEGFPGHWYREHGEEDPLSGLSPRSFWMTLPAITDQLRAGGYAVEVVAHEPEHQNGPLVTLIARRV